MKSKVIEELESGGMLLGTSCIAVALSGGADSVSLLHVLDSLRGHYGFTLRAIHVHHGIRGEAADRDEQFCRDFCADFGVELDVYHFDVPSLAAEQGKGLEECGRDCRYSVFAEAAQAYNCRIATAHTLSDSVETMLLNLARGCGIAGLRGIPAARDYIIRPLIRCTREEIERYCAEKGLSYVTDETNFDDSFSRNRVRLDIIPELKKINPDFFSAAARLMESASADEKFLGESAVKALSVTAIDDKSWDSVKISAYPAPIRRRMIIAISERLLDKSPSFTQIKILENMLFSGFGSVTLGKDSVLSVRNGRLFAENPEKPEGIDLWEMPLGKDNLLPDGRRLFVECISYKEYQNRVKNDNYLFKKALGCDIIECNAVIRNRREGDTFKQAGRKGTKKVKKLFNECKIPPEERSNRVFLERSGSIIWIEGFGAAEGMQPSGQLERVSIIHIE